jgi:hypothetical protein
MKQNVITNVEPVIRKALNLTGRQVSNVSYGAVDENPLQLIFKLPLPPEEPAVVSSKKVSYPDESERGLCHRPTLSLILLTAVIDYSNRTKEVQRIPIPPTSRPRLHRPHPADERKSMSPPQADHQMNSIKRSTSNYTAFPTSPPSESSVSVESAMFSDADLDVCSSPSLDSYTFSHAYCLAVGK